MSSTNNLIESIELAENNQYFIIKFKELLYSDSNQNNYLNIDNLDLKLLNGNAKLTQNNPELIFKNDDNYVVLISLSGKPNGSEIIHIQFNSVYNNDGFLIDKDQIGNYIQLNKFEDYKTNYKTNKKPKPKIIKQKQPFNIHKKSLSKNNDIEKQNYNNQTVVPNLFHSFYHYSIDNKKENKLPVKSKSSLLKSISSNNDNYTIDDYLRDYDQEKIENKISIQEKNNTKYGTTCYANMTIIQSNPGLAYKLNLIKYNAYVASLYPSYYGTIPKKYPPQYFMSSYDRIFNPTKEVKPLT